ncbi:MAG: hypothetical protein V1797_19520 [Pseudomonadota bacterium]
MGFTDQTSKFHDGLRQAMERYQGKTITKKVIDAVVSMIPGLQADAQWILPSDHCVNHTCKGACRCSLTPDALFERVGWGKYLVR